MLQCQHNTFDQITVRMSTDPGVRILRYTQIIHDYKSSTVVKTNKLFARLPDIQDLNKLIDSEEQRNILKNMFITEDFTKVLEFKESALQEYGLRNNDIEIYRNSKSVADVTKELLDKFNIEDYSKDYFNTLAEDVITHHSRIR